MAKEVESRLDAAMQALQTSLLVDETKRKEGGEPREKDADQVAVELVGVAGSDSVPRARVWRRPEATRASDSRELRGEGGLSVRPRFVSRARVHASSCRIPSTEGRKEGAPSRRVSRCGRRSAAAGAEKTLVTAKRAVPRRTASSARTRRWRRSPARCW